MNNSSDASAIYRSTASAPYLGETTDRVQHLDIVNSAAPVPSDVSFSLAPSGAPDHVSTGPKVTIQPIKRTA